MAKRKDKVSVAEIESLVENNTMPLVISGVNGDVTIMVTKSISLQSMLEMVNDVVYSCFDTETSDYSPEVYDFALKANIINRFTNCNLPKNISTQYELIYTTPIVKSVISMIDFIQLNSIEDAIYRKIKYLIGLNENSLRQEVNTATEALNNLTGKFTEMFNGINIDEAINAMTEFSKIDLKEETLAQAILETQDKNENVSPDNIVDIKKD